MENKSKSLEGNLREPDWKQRLPVWGICQVAKDSLEGKPIVFDTNKPREYFLNIYLQAVSITALAYILSC